MEKIAPVSNLMAQLKCESYDPRPLLVSEVLQCSEDECDCHGHIEENEPSWYTCGVCRKNVAGDCDVKRFPCLHLVCGSPYDCFQKVLVTKRNPFGRNALKTVSVFATCPLCKTVYSEFDVKDGRDERSVMQASDKKHCSCQQLSKYQCTQCDTTFCDTCAQHHDSIIHFKTRHFLQSLGEEQLFMCSMCEVEKGEFVLEGEDRQILKHFCQDCKERNGNDLATWKDYYENINRKYENFIHTFSEMAYNADILMSNITFNSSRKNTTEKISSSNTILPGTMLGSESANGMDNLQLQQKDVEKVRIVILRIRHIKGFFKALLSSFGIGAVKFKNFSLYEAFAYHFKESITLKLETLLQKYSQRQSLLTMQNTITTGNNDELIDSNQESNILLSHELTGTRDTDATNCMETDRKGIYPELTQNSEYVIITPKISVRFETIPIKVEGENKCECEVVTSGCNVEENDSNIEGLNGISNIRNGNETLNIQDVSETSNIQDVSETSNIQDVSETSNIQDVSETSNIEDLNRISNIQDVNETSNIQDVSETSNIEDLNGISNIQDVNEISNIQNVSETSNIGDVNNETSNIQDVNETPNIENGNEPSNIQNGNETSNLGDLYEASMTSNILEFYDKISNSQITETFSKAQNVTEISNDEGTSIKIWIAQNLFETSVNDEEVNETPNFDDLSDISSDQVLSEISIEQDLSDISILSVISSDQRPTDISKDPNVREIASGQDPIKIPHNQEHIEISNSQNLSVSSNEDFNGTSKDPISNDNNAQTQDANATSNGQILNETSNDQVVNEIAKALVVTDGKENSLDVGMKEKSAMGTSGTKRVPSSSTSSTERKPKRKKLSNGVGKCDCLGRLCKICSLKMSPSEIIRHNISPVNLEIRHYDMLKMEIEGEGRVKSTYLQLHIRANLEYDDLNGSVSEGTCAICFDGGSPLVVCDNNKCGKVFGDKCHIPSFKRIPDDITWNCLFCINKNKFASLTFQKQAREIYIVPENAFEGDIHKFLTACKFMSDLYSIHESLVMRFKFVHFYQEKHKTNPAFNLNEIRDRLINPSGDTPPYSSHHQLVEDLNIMIKQATNLFPKKSKEMTYLVKFQKLYHKKTKDYFP